MVVEQEENLVVVDFFYLYGGLSRFITPAVAACFDRVDGGLPALAVDSAASGGAEAGAAIDVAARMRAIWG